MPTHAITRIAGSMRHAGSPEPRHLFAALRLSAQGITGSGLSDASDVVGWLGAVQAQDYSAAKWALGLRMPIGTANDSIIEGAIANGSILRTHVMRRTWQFVSAKDLRWMLDLVAPRLIARSQGRYRQLGLDAATFGRCATILAKTLDDGHALTRDEIGSAFERAGVSADGPRLSHLLVRAELGGIICSGPPRGGHHTYVLLEHRAPLRVPIRRDEAVAELVRRYFRSRGPASLRDFVWWSGLTAKEARAGVMAIRSSLAADVVNGETFWWRNDAPAPARSHCVHLLPAFDEYVLAYRDRTAVLDAKYSERVNAGGGRLSPVIIIDGRVAGTWQRTALGVGTVSMRAEMFESVRERERLAIAGAAQRYADFLQRDARIEVVATARRRSSSPHPS